MTETENKPVKSPRPRARTTALEKVAAQAGVTPATIETAVAAMEPTSPAPRATTETAEKPKRLVKRRVTAAELADLGIDVPVENVPAGAEVIHDAPATEEEAPSAPELPWLAKLQIGYARITLSRQLRRTLAGSRSLDRCPICCGTLEADPDHVLPAPLKLTRQQRRADARERAKRARPGYSTDGTQSMRCRKCKMHFGRRITKDLTPRTEDGAE